MSSAGFTGIVSARYFSSSLFPLPSLNDPTNTGLDIINKYTVSEGGGSTTSTFFAPYALNNLSTTLLTYDLCSGFQNLGLIMGLLNTQLDIDVVSERGLQTPEVVIKFKYTYNTNPYVVVATVSNKGTVSTAALLPIPVVINDVSGSVYNHCSDVLGIGVQYLPIYVLLNKTPSALYSEINNSSSTGTVCLSAYLIADRSKISPNVDLTQYTPVLSDVDSTLQVPFTFNRSILSNLPDGPGTSDVVILGGFSAKLQYQQFAIPSGTTTVASSVNNTLGSTILRNA